MSKLEETTKVEKLFFAGTTVPHQIMPRLYGNIIRDETSNIPVSERLIALPANGLVSIETTLAILKKRVTRMREEHPDSKFILGGHSQGGVVANELALMGLADGVVSYAAPDRGVEYAKDSYVTRAMLLGMRALNGVMSREVPLLPAIQDMAHDSDFTADHIRRMETEWPAHVPRFAVAATRDGLVPLHSVLGATPDSVDWMITPHSTVVPEGVSIYPDKPTDHINITMTRGARSLMNMMELYVSQEAKAVA